MIGVTDIVDIGIMRNDDDVSFVRIGFGRRLDILLVPVIRQRSQNQVITVKNDIDQFLTFFLVIVMLELSKTMKKFDWCTMHFIIPFKHHCYIVFKC